MTVAEPSPDRPLRVLIAPDSFKGTIDAAAAAAALRLGWLLVRPGDRVETLPLADGGEGTLDVIAAAVPGARPHTLRVTGPDSRAVEAAWLLLPDGGAVVELARSSGLPLMAAPDPLGAHTYGLGEVLAAAIDAGATRIDVALGGSASTDGGSGALAALGARLLADDGAALPPGGGALARLARVDLSRLRRPPPGGARLLVDTSAPLLGPAGAAAVFGPQKGAGPADAALLEAGLARLAATLGGRPGEPGSGAAGGTAFGLAAAWGAEIASGAQAVAELVRLRDRLAEVDVVITGEGRFDATSLLGKVVGMVARTVAGLGSRPVLAVVAGTSALPAPPGVDMLLTLADLAGSVVAAREQPALWLREAGTHLAAEFRRPA